MRTGDSPAPIVRDGEFPLPDLATLPADGGAEWNRLVFSSSPYLLQHARNPVDWHPWGDEAFARARTEDRPVFLSIGYSTCHWCHVMERESFVDAEVAALLNEHYVAVKVDREERPDVDHVYMTVCQAATGSGGWPLTALLAPDGRPFFVGTYFPKEDAFGRPGLLRILAYFAGRWRGDRAELLRAGADIASHLAAVETRTPEEFPDDASEQAVRAFERSFDPVWGGFGGAPKFPMPHTLGFLLQRAAYTGDTRPREMAERTLSMMHRGGIFDHVGSGFCRYSTDGRWLVPHFEKMLYDNALLLDAYVDAFLATRKPAYAGVARAVTDYLLRDLADPAGGLYAAENADSEGAEGKFYVFTRTEFLAAAGAERGAAMAEYFGVTEEGNFEHGTNVLHIDSDPEEWAARHGLDAAAAARAVEETRAALFRVRSRRVHPSRDDKVLASWNGLAIAALARAGRALGDTRALEAARRAADFALANLCDADHRLLHRWRRGTAGIDGFLEDYAFLAHGLLELYTATFEARYLARALGLAGRMRTDFLDERDGSLFSTSAAAETLLARPKELSDGAVPSGNSVAAFVFVRLARITGRPDWEEAARRIFAAAAAEVRRVPTAFAFLLSAYDEARGPSREIVLAARDAAHAAPLAGVVASLFLPHAVVLFHPEGDAGEQIRALAPFVREYRTVDGRPAAYVCTDRACSLPVTEPGALRELLCSDAAADA